MIFDISDSFRSRRDLDLGSKVRFGFPVLVSVVIATFQSIITLRLLIVRPESVLYCYSVFGEPRIEALPVKTQIR
jgi:hypothetical protein